jgi:ribosomal protein S18 acetylase RimI-like enzyme
MPSLLDDPEAYAFAAQVAEDERKKLGLQSLLGGIGGLLEAPVSYVKERATTLATDPIGDMKRTIQGTMDRAKAREQLQQIAYGDPTNPLRVTDQAAADQLAQDYLDMASTIMPMGMVAPKSGLLGGNAFDMSKADASDIFGAGAQKTTYKDPDSGGHIQVLTRPDYPASVLGLEVPEAFRRQGIGGRLQEQAIKDFPNMQGQVSSKAAARSAYKLGRRPVGKPDASLEDVFKMIDDDSSVNLVSPSRQKEISETQGGLLDTDYRGSHSAPNAEVYGATLDDLTKIMPANVYSPEGKQLYGLGDRLVDSEWRIAALKTRGKPDAEIEVYRAVPKGVKDINSGDWVTTSKTYASQHGERTLDGDYEIIKKKVKAKTLSSEGYPYEFGYNE